MRGILEFPRKEGHKGPGKETQWGAAKQFGEREGPEAYWEVMAQGERMINDRDGQGNFKTRMPNINCLKCLAPILY